MQTAAPVPLSGVPLVATTGSLLLGGSSTFLLNLARAFRRLELAVPVVVLSDRCEHREDFTTLGAEVTCLSSRNRIYEDRLLWGYQQAARHRPRAVLACLSSESFEILRLVPATVARLGIVQSDDPLPYRLVRHYAPWLDAMVGVSRRICDRLRALPECANLRVEYIPYGIDFPGPVARTPRRAELPVRAIYLGRLIEEQKRISRLASLIHVLEQEKANVEFTIVGAGPDEAAFRRATADCRHVTFRGAVPNREVAPLLREQDIFILLSDFEGLPLSLLEAMGEGVVPVVSDLDSGIREVVTDDCGVRVPVGDVAAAAAAVTRLAQNPADLFRLSAAAVRCARDNYSADLMAGRFLALIEDIAPPRPPFPWPATLAVPAPQLLPHPWLYRGVPRQIRRMLRRWSRP